MRYVLMTATMLACTVAAFAQAKAGNTSADKDVAPFISDQTVVVAKLNLQKIDSDALWQKVVDFTGMKKGDPEEKQALAARAEMKAWLDDFKQIGGRDIYVVVDLNDLPPEPWFVVVPLADGAKADDIGQWLVTGKSKSPQTQPAERQHGRSPFMVREYARIGNAVVAGRDTQLKRLKELYETQFKLGRLTPRPEFAKGLQAAGDHAIQAVFALTPDARRVIDEMLPVLPLPTGKVPSKVLTQGVLWVAVGVEPPPKSALHVIVQSQDDAAAKALQTELAKLLPVGLDAANKAIEMKLSDAKMAEILKTLTPVQKGDRLVLAMDAKQIDMLVTELMVPSLRRARQHARIAASMSNMHSIVMACHVYASKNKGQWPDNLEVLVKGGYLPKAVLVNPRDDAGKTGYVYIKPAASTYIAVTVNVVVLHDQFDQWPKLGIGAAFADGQIKRIRDKAEFDKLMQVSKTASTQPAK